MEVSHSLPNDTAGQFAQLPRHGAVPAAGRKPEMRLDALGAAMAQCGQPCKSKTPTGNSKSNSLPTGAASTPAANTSAICAA